MLPQCRVRARALEKIVRCPAGHRNFLFVRQAEIIHQSVDAEHRQLPAWREGASRGQQPGNALAVMHEKTFSEINSLCASITGQFRLVGIKLHPPGEPPGMSLSQSFRQHSYQRHGI